MSATGSCTGDETSSDDDVSLNDLSVNHNNDLFRGDVAETCVDALAHLDLAAESFTTEDLDETKPRRREDTQYLLAGKGEYHAPVGEDSTKLWNKAMTTLAKGKCKNEDKRTNEKDTDAYPGSPGEGKLSAYDMSDILDGSIHGGEAPPSDNKGNKQRKLHVIASSEFSIDGESAMVWGDDPEKAYFAYMLELEAEHRALEGKDQDDSLMAESTRQELLLGVGGVTASFGEEDDTTLGNPSKVFGGWDPSTMVGPSAQISSLTPSFHKLGDPLQQRDKDGQLIIPNVIYVQDGVNPDCKFQPRSWDTNGKSSKSFRKPEQALKNASQRPVGNKSKAAAKRLEEGTEGVDAAQQQHPKSGSHTNRLLIGAALFFLCLTTGLVALLIVYRNNYANESPTTSTSGTNFDENRNPADLSSVVAVKKPSEAPSPAPYTSHPTVDLFQKKDSSMDDDIDEDEDESASNPSLPTEQPTWTPTAAPTWTPTKVPSFEPTWTPSERPSIIAMNAPSTGPTTRLPTEQSSLQPTSVASDSPTHVPSISLTRATSLGPSAQRNADSPSTSPTTGPSMLPTALLDTPPEHNAPAPEKNATSTLGPSLSSTIIVIIGEGSNDRSTNPTAPSNSPTTKATPTRLPTRSPSEVPATNAAGSATPSANPTPTRLASANETSGNPTQTLSLAATGVTTGTPSPGPTREATSTQLTPSPTLQPTPRSPTTLLPTPLLTRYPTQSASVPPYVALETVRNFLLEYTPLSTEDLFNADSTQFKALVWLAGWMASIPAQQLGRITKKRLVQRWALAVLYLELSGPTWLKGSKDWMGEEDPCFWLSDNNQGSCDADLLVATLDLSSNNLRGTLPKEISLLSDSMARLEMDRNNISGPIPEQIGQMKKLVSLDFTRCDLTGTLPSELGNLQSLAILGLGRNDFTGTIPSEIAKLDNLVYLGLERNAVRGTIPSELSYLVFLEYIALDWNALTGSIPTALTNLLSLRTLILARNSLVGTVPNLFCQRSMDFLAADCDEVSCPCCDLCCEKGGGCAST